MFSCIGWSWLNLFSDSLLFQLRGGYECKSNRFKYSESTLFFLSGNGSGFFVKSDLEIPAPFRNCCPFTCYFLLDLREGGTNQSGITQEVVLTLLAAIPVFCPYLHLFLCSSWSYLWCRCDRGNLWLHQRRNFHYSWSISERTRDWVWRYMVAALALMESPAIIVGIILVNLFTPNQRERDFSGQKCYKKRSWIAPSFYWSVASWSAPLSGEHGWQVWNPLLRECFTVF